MLDDALMYDKNQQYGKALRLYAKLSSQLVDEPIVYFKLGIYYLKGRGGLPKSRKKAIAYLEEADKLGYLKATYNLGIIYFHLNDMDKGYSYIYNAHTKGYANATNYIAKLLLHGKYLKKDYKQAVKFFELASQRGSIDANCNLALAYVRGMGVFKNFGRAHQFAKKGKDLGNKLCQKVWNDYKLYKYKTDKGFKFGYTKPVE